MNRTSAAELRHDFHPAVAAWFASSFPAETEAQRRAWPLIAAGQPTLIAAPTGSGKTLTAFLAAIDALVRESGAGPLPDETRVLYVSPLKALSNDIRVNLVAPLEGIAGQLEAMGLPPHGIRSAVRTGDTTQKERNAMRRRAPHILVSTPESLYVLLGSDSGRAMLAGVRTVIVDEIHAVAGSKRGSTCPSAWSAWTRCARNRRCASACPPPRSRCPRLPTSWPAPVRRAISARWWTWATCARATWGWNCRRCRWKR